MYIKLKNGNFDRYPYSINLLKQDNKDTSFPDVMPDERLAEWEVYPVVPSSSPAVDYTKNVKEEIPNLVEGVWHQSFIVVDASDEEIAERKAKINADAEVARAKEYRNESDPIFFKWQRGEATEQEWLDKVAEIKARHPKV